MNKELLGYIRQLSLKDKKTLSQKALKVAEESGELAKVVLPLDNAPGTIHRFVDKNKTLEEAVDVILTAISIPYELGFTDDDIMDVMWRKAEKWQGIQSKEKNFDENNIPFEIHVTVDLSDYVRYLTRIEKEHKAGRFAESDYEMKTKEEIEERAIESFKSLCNNMGVKPIIIDLENGGKSVMKDVMTSSRFVGSNAGALMECKRISGILEAALFKVVREKIETVPWHPAAPLKEGEDMPGNCYFEAHIGCIISPDEKEILEEIAEAHDAHLSRNFFKKIEDDKFVNMITLRHNKFDYDCFDRFLEDLKNSLVQNNISFEKVISEFAIYDTKVSHDFLWTKK
jgi:NTP pyrophosphatase (non-canonical NTP hydrolase)